MKTVFRILTVVLVLAFIMQLAIGCTVETEPTETQEPTTTSPGSTSITPTTPAPTEITVIDQEGISVTIPYDVQRVVSIYPMATLIAYSLNGQDKLVGIDSNSPGNEILQAVDPNITNITAVGMPWEVNIETVLSLDPDVVIGGFGDVRTALEDVGVPVIGVNLESPELLKEGIGLIGQCIGKTKEADALIAYYDEKMGIITDRTASIPESERIRVLIPNKTGKASCTGGDSYQNYLIEGAGGINVAREVTGRWPEASVEQISLWDPQVIIVPPYCVDTPEDILSDPAWQHINAVKNRRVYLMPQYTVAWDTPVADSILGELWIASKLYPELFSDIDINTEADAFYTRFYATHYLWEKRIIDSVGNEVIIPSYVENVATLRAGITEIVCALGMRGKIAAVENGVKDGTGYGEFIAGVYPDLMERDCPILGYDPNLEEMLRINPDLILIGGYGRMKWVEPLQQTGLPVVVSHFETLENYMDDIRIVAQCVNAEERAEELITYLESKLDLTADMVAGIPQAEKVKALFVGHDVYHVYTSDTFEHTQIEAAGGINVASDMTGWLPEVSPEQLIMWDPDVIFTLSGIDTEAIINDDKIADVSAIKNGRVYALPESGWDFASPRALFAIEWLASRLYPELFSDIDIVAEVDEFYNNVFGVNYGGPALVETRTITDMAGRTVTIPGRANRIVSISPDATIMVYELNGQDKLAGMSLGRVEAQVMPVLQQVYPSSSDIPLVGASSDANMEEIMALEPDIVLAKSFTDLNEMSESMGVPIVCIAQESVDELRESYRLIGNVIGRAMEANTILHYFDSKVNYILEHTGVIADADKKKVYITAVDPLSTMGGDAYQEYLITTAGGINVGSELSGFGAQVSLEQIIQWDPDIVLVVSYCQLSADEIKADSQWQTLRAVQNGEVYDYPSFMGPWDAPGSKSLIGMIWLASVLYPEEMSFDIYSEIKEYYATVYRYIITDEEINGIFNP